MLHQSTVSRSWQSVDNEKKDRCDLLPMAAFCQILVQDQLLFWLFVHPRSKITLTTVACGFRQLGSASGGMASISNALMSSACNRKVYLMVILRTNGRRHIYLKRKKNRTKTWLFITAFTVIKYTISVWLGEIAPFHPVAPFLSCFMADRILSCINRVMS